MNRYHVFFAATAGFVCSFYIHNMWMAVATSSIMIFMGLWQLND